MSDTISYFEPLMKTIPTTSVAHSCLKIDRRDHRIFLKGAGVQRTGRRRRMHTRYPGLIRPQYIGDGAEW